MSRIILIFNNEKKIFLFITILGILTINGCSKEPEKKEESKEQIIENKIFSEEEIQRFLAYKKKAEAGDDKGMHH